MDGIELAQNRDRWRAVVSAVMNTEAPFRENLKERDHLGDPGVDERTILRWIFRKWGVGVWTGLSWLKIGTGGVQL